MGLQYNLGHTFESEKDPYYSNNKGDSFIYYMVDYQASVHPSQRTKFVAYLELASSDMPPWFGDQALIIDPKISPYRRTPGLQAGIRFEVELGKKKKKK